MKDTVPDSSVNVFNEGPVTRVNPKSASMALGGSESEMRMFCWEHDSFQDQIFHGWLEGLLL